MFTNLRSYLPFFIIIAASLMLALVGFVTGLSDFNARQEAAASATLPPEVLSGPPTATPRPSSPPLRPPQDSLTVALSGEMANGGYWSWQDIINLLGVYGTAGQMQSATVEGSTYRGVPLAYLLRYARVNGEADRLLVVTRSGRQTLYSLRSIDDFMDYVIAPAGNTLALVPPYGQELDVLQGLISIQTLRAADMRNTQMVAIPARPDSLLLTGQIQRDGLWTWNDLTGLLGVYGTAGAYRTVTVSSGTYTGVPLAYLFEYAQVTRDRVNLIMVYSRGGTEYTRTGALLTCENCIIARANDGTLALIQPGGDSTPLWQLANIHIP